MDSYQRLWGKEGKRLSLKRSFFRYVSKSLGIQSLCYSLDDLQKRVNQQHVLNDEFVTFAFLNSLPKLATSAILNPVDVLVQGRNRAFNPSIAKIPGGYIVVVRDTNMLVENDGQNYKYLGLPHRTDNLVLELDEKLNVVRTRKLNDENFCCATSAVKNGIEDIRILNVGDKILALGAGIDIREDRRVISQVRFEIIEDKIVDLRVVPSPFDSTTEKNWMPFVYKEDVCVVHSVLPLNIFRLNGCKLEILNAAVPPKRPSFNGHFQLCGSTNGVSWKDGHLFVVHARFSAANKIFFVHYLMYLDCELNLLQITSPFLFERLGIEFATGLVVSKEGLLISYGLADRRSRILQLESSEVDELLCI